MPQLHYKGHLRERERYAIDMLRRIGWSCRAIAARIGRHHSVVAREIARNISSHKGAIYLHDLAQRRARARLRQPRRKHRLAELRLRFYVEDRIRRFWSPEQIAGRLTIDFPRSSRMRLSSETIYRWIYRDSALNGSLYCHLRRRRKRRKAQSRKGFRRGLIPGRVSIRERGRIAEARRRFGDWEGDLLEGKRGSGSILTLVERKSRYLIATKPGSGKAGSVSKAMTKLLSRCPEDLRRSMTLDNGREFAAFRKVEQKTGIKVYFADPYCAWQRGTNENTNGLIRQYIPKGCDMIKISKHHIETAVQALNHRPPKMPRLQNTRRGHNR